MKYTVIQGDTEVAVDLREIAPGRYEVQAFGRRFELAAHLATDGRLIVREGHAQWHADPGLADASFLVLNAREAHRRELGRTEKAGGGAWELRAPMPGKLVAVAAGPDQEVKAGEWLLTIEAMKMENELRA